MSWKIGDSERTKVRKVLTFLEDRRALFSEIDLNVACHAQKSMRDIRDVLTSAIAELPEGCPAAESFRGMRAAARELMDLQGPGDAGARYYDIRNRRYTEQDVIFIEKLGQVRAIFGQHLAIIAYHYDLNIEKGLRSILPPAPRPTDDEPAPKERL
jgi:hypothetical protein